MKTNQFLILSLLCLTIQLVKAQATVVNATNTITATNYLGSGATSNFDVIFRRNNVNAGLLNTTKTAFGVNALAMLNSVSVGVGAGQFSSGTGNNTFIGHEAGKGNALTNLNSGTFNTFIGTYAGINNNSGSGNIAIGYNSAKQNFNQNNNIIIGNSAGNEDGSHGNNNIFIGHLSGFTEGNGNTLVIDNAGETDRAFIWGDMLNDRLKFHAKVAIGGTGIANFGNFPTTSGAVNNVANYNLFVKGGILTEEIRVSLATTWADYVFSKDYTMPTLPELEKQIQEKGHLPNMPSAQEVAANGIELGEMAKMQQEKIEELTLYIIQINKELQELKAKIKN